MPYVPIYHPDVVNRDLPKIPLNIKNRIQRAIEERLMVDPVQSGEPLRRSLKGHRKLRVGDWRIIYRIKGESVIILIIQNRKEVYKNIFRRL